MVAQNTSRTNPQQTLASSSPNSYPQQASYTPEAQNSSPYSHNGNTGTTNRNTTTATPTPYSTSTDTSSGTTGSDTGWAVPTVEDEMAKLTSSDSITMQQAKNEGLRTAASRGLLNSSIAGQAAQQAAIQTAAPIAEKNVANQLAQQQFAQGVTANTHGKYMMATQDIVTQANISINEIETATNISQGEKDKMIANTIKRRDADLAFMKEYYSMMPTWSGSWVNFPTMPTAPGVSI
ncbi:MAG: hypothetical protein LPD71_00180 [Shewanella sp.]|nr:hypothetical protein [Shewanella sp.]MCF1457211.1 hypothetical protein [Shewanella sp.]